MLIMIPQYSTSKISRRGNSLFDVFWYLLASSAFMNPIHNFIIIIKQENLGDVILERAFNFL